MECVTSSLAPLYTEHVQLATSVVGSLFLASLVIKAGSFLWQFVRPSSVGRYRHVKDEQGGSWALITGSSDGIGFGFAEVFLLRGFNVLLHGRNPEKLARIQRELSLRFPYRKIDTVVADASASDDSYFAVAEKARTLPGKLTVLVNNVGGVATDPQLLPHAEVPHGDIDTCINLNARFPTQLTRALLPLLKANAPSLILNTGSIGALYGMPYIATYVATKAYIHTFTLALRNEVAAEGDEGRLEVMSSLIGNTLSSRNRTAMPFFTIGSRECAAGCVARVGSGRVLNWASWRHAVQGIATDWMPEGWLRGILAREMKVRMEVERKGT